MTIKIRFNDADEYIEEIRKSGVKDNIVRLTNRTKDAGTLPIRHYSVVSTYINNKGQVVELETYVGQLWRQEKTDKEVYDRAEQIANKIKTACGEMGIYIRAGVFMAGEEK